MTRACFGARALPRPAWPIPRATAPADSLARELLTVPHGRPHVRLHVGQRLADVVPVVVDPFLEQVADPQEADLGVLAPTVEIGLAQTTHERDAVVPQPGEFIEQRGHRPRAVAPRAGDRVLIPALEGRAVGAQDDADPPREAAALGLDEVADDLLGAPLARRGMPGGDTLGQRAELGAASPWRPRGGPRPRTASAVNPWVSPAGLDV